MNSNDTYRNPIVPGYYPDPSICRVGEDFYLVNSTFAYFPGLPVWHSRDLVHWEQIGNVLDRPSQLPLEGSGSSQGLFAPTIRHFRGTFYVVCTNIDHGGNFIVTAKDPAGPWSEPAWLGPEAAGIDPSLLFEEDAASGEARAWYCGTRGDTTQEKFWGDNEIYVRELDLGSLKLKGEAKAIWKGALRDCAWAEGPHLYKIGGWYYLMIAEGGTGFQHAITIARSKKIDGPYEGDPSNPILTNRHLGKGWPVVYVGHGDLVQDPTGAWWMVHLASRPRGGFTTLGRETFLVPVAWEDDWPLPAPRVGYSAESFPAPDLPRFEPLPAPACDGFDGSNLGHHWISLRGPATDFASLAARPGWLRLEARAATLRDKAKVSFVARRQVDRDCAIRSLLEFEPEREGEAAGIAFFQGEDWHYRLELAASASGRAVRLVCAEGGPEKIIAEKPYAAGRIALSGVNQGGKLSFYFGSSPDKLELLAGGLEESVLSTERAGGFIGTVVGLFASGGGSASTRHADFDFFEYQGFPDC